MANLIFERIKDYGIMHSSHAITDSILKAITKSLPSISDYLESRIVKAEH